MASEEIEGDVNQFKKIEAQIHSLFEHLISVVKSRRDRLLKELHDRYFKYEQQVKTRNKTIHDLKKMKDRMEKVSLEDNLVFQFREESIANLQEQIQAIQEKIETPKLQFTGSVTEELIFQVDQLGEIIEDGSISLTNIKSKMKTGVLDYSKKREAMVVIGTKGSECGQFDRPSRIYIDHCTSRLYVPDSDNKRIQVLSLAGEYISQFGDGDVLFPVSVATDRDFCYVSDNTQHCVLRYQLSDYKFLNKQRVAGGSSRMLKLPRGLAVGQDNQILVADNNDRICVFNIELKYRGEFGRGLLRTPQSVQTREDQILVLDCGNPCVHIFNTSGDKLSSIITRGILRQIRDGTSHCLDSQGNIIITDRGAERIRVFSPNGNLIHNIGGEVMGTEDVGSCWGVAVAGDKLFVAGRSDEKHFIKIF